MMRSPRPRDLGTRKGTWGMRLRPNQKFSVVFEQAFHLKMAVLDFHGAGKQDLRFRVTIQDNKDELSVPLVLCTLSKGTTLQMPLDLHFEKGDDVTFILKTEANKIELNMEGNSYVVHLSGDTDRDPDVFVAPPKVLQDKRPEELMKSRSYSLPDDRIENKSKLPSKAATMSVPASPAITLTPPHSPTIALLSSEIAESENNVDDNKPSKKKDNWAKKSFGKGQVFGKIGKFLTKD